jgi:hypothetical protein
MVKRDFLIGGPIDAGVSTDIKADPDRSLI